MLRAFYRYTHAFKTCLFTCWVQVYDWLLARARGHVVASERLRALSALGYASDTHLQLRTLRLAILGAEDGAVRAQDAPRVLSSLVYAQGAAGRRLAWAFCVQNWQALIARFEGSMFMIERIISVLVSGMTWPSDIENAREFFRLHPVAAAEQALAQALENANQNVAFIEANQEALCSYLSSHSQP